MVLGKQGLSLIEVLVASALLGITTVASFKAADLQTRSRILQAQDEAFMRMVRGIELILSTQSTCDANFKGQSLSNRSINKLDRLDASLPSENSSSPFILIQKSGGFTPGVNIPAGTGTSKETVRAESLLLNSVGESREDPSIRRYSLELTVSRPDTQARLQRTFEVILQHDLDARDEAVIKCVLPEATVVGGGGPSTGDILLACLSEVGGDLPVDEADEYYCDITRTICRQLNLEYDYVTHKCNASQVRAQLLMGMIGSGQCRRSKAFGFNPGESRFGEVLKGFAVDGNPICASDILAPVPHIGKSLIPTTSRPNPPACSECWMDSPVDCRQYTDASTSERAQGYRIFKHGVLFRTGCGNASIAGLPRCEMHPQAAVPCGPNPGQYGPPPTTTCHATSSCNMTCCVYFLPSPTRPQGWHQMWRSGVLSGLDVLNGPCPANVAECRASVFTNPDCSLTGLTRVHPSCPQQF